jgi:hypothetical protein
VDRQREIFQLDLPARLIILFKNHLDIEIDKGILTANIPREIISAQTLIEIDIHLDRGSA